MSKRYIRVFCNGEHIRSAGTETWYRNAILKTFGIGENCPGKELLIKNGKEMYHQIPVKQRENYKEKCLTFRFLIEFVRVTKKNGKTVDDTQVSPYHITIDKNGNIYIICKRSLMMCNELVGNVNNIT